MKLRVDGSLVVAVAGVILAAGYLWVGTDYSAGTFEEPGAGLFPRGIGVALLAVSILGAVAALRLASPELLEVAGREWGRVALTMAGLIGFGILLPRLGSVPAIFFLSVAALLVTGWRGKVSMIIFSAVLALVIHFSFIKLLGVQLPSGILPEW